MVRYNQSSPGTHHLVKCLYETARRPNTTSAWLLSTRLGHLDLGKEASTAARQQLCSDVKGPVAQLPSSRYPEVEHFPTELDPHRLPVYVDLVVLLPQQHLRLSTLVVHLPVREAE